MQPTRQIKQIIGANVLERRLALGLTRRALAEELGVEQGVIYKWERGLHRPSDANMPDLIRVLGRDHGWFVTDHSAEMAA